MNSARQQLNSAIGAAGVVAVCAGMLTAPAHEHFAPIVARELPVVLQASVSDIVTRVTDAITYGVAVAPVWYLGLPISIPISIGIGFGLADLIPVVGSAFGLTLALDQVTRTVVGLGLAVAAYALGPPFMAVSSLLGITYPSVLPAAAHPAGATSTGPRSAAVHRSTGVSTVTTVRSAPRATAARTGKGPAAAASRTHAKRQAR